MIRCLCAGESRAKMWVVSDGFGEFVVGHRFDLAAEEDIVGFQAYLPADLAGHEIVVAGEDFHGDAVLLQRVDRLGCRVLRRIEKGDITLEDQVALILLGNQRLRCRGACGRRRAREIRRRSIPGIAASNRPTRIGSIGKVSPSSS